MAKRVFQGSALGAPYDDMVSRIYELTLQLLAADNAGQRLAVASCADRLAGQARALADLLVMSNKED